MKRIRIAIILLCLCVSAQSQYYAYTVNGEAQVMRGGEWKAVYSTMELQTTDLLRTSEYGHVTVLDRTNNKIYSLQTVDAKPIEQLISNVQPHTRRLMQEYIIGMYNKLFGIEEERTKGMATQGGVTYRGEEEEREIARAILHCRKGELPVSFLLLDFQTRQPVERVREGQMVIVQFNNLSDTPLYMNIIDRDAEGTESAIFPLDEKQAILTLYVPAFSSVRMHEYPLTFAPAGTTDKLTLVAYPYPFELTNVVKLLKDTEIQQATGKTNPIGIYQQTIPIIR